MPENYKVAATVLSMGDMEQVSYTNKQGQPAVFTKFKVECKVNNESITYEANGFHRSKLEVGGHYALEIQPNDYTHNIRKIESIQAPSGHLVKAAEAMGAVITEEATIAPPPNTKQAVSQNPPLRPDVKVRWEQNQMHARTAQMQATERVGIYKDIFLAGKLLNDEGASVDKLRKSTVEAWFSEEIDRYWHELDVRVPYDAHGRLAEGSDASS